MMRLLPQMVLGALAGLWLLFEAAAPQAATDTGVYVDFRASEAVDAPVTERWRLYGASHALIIGIDNYTNGWPRLSNAVKDATLVAGELRRKGFEVELLTDVTGAQLREALRRFFVFKGKDPQARLFVWFAGHGYTEYGEGYLVPADAPPPSSPEFFYTALHMGDVGSMVRIAKSKHVLAVFDSCFAGTVFSSQRARPPPAITAAVKRPVRQFLTSGDADQQVSDDGAFRTLFLRALRGEETADANRDGYLTGTELSFYLEDRMINLTQGMQTPRGGKLRDPRFDQGDFVFLLPQVAAAVVLETPAPSPAPSEPGRAALELEFWNSIKDSDNPADYQAYLETFPSGTFSRLARNRLTELSNSQRPAEPSGTKSTVEPTTVAPEPQVATLPPASAPAKQDAGSFDGEWDLEIWVESFFPSGLKTRVKITNNKFTVPLKDTGVNGRIQAEILSDGALVGSGVIDRTLGWSTTVHTLTFSSPFRDGVFSAQGAVHGRGGGQRYRIVLTRATQTATAETQVAAAPPAAAPSEDLVGSYEGEWSLKLWVERMILNAAETRVFVTDGKFSAKISADGTRGTLSGKILSDGTLEGSGDLKKMGWSQRTFVFTARYRNGQFTAQGPAKSRGSPSNFRLVLTRPQQSVQ